MTPREQIEVAAKKLARIIDGVAREFNAATGMAFTVDLRWYIGKSSSDSVPAVYLLRAVVTPCSAREVDCV